MGGQSTPSTQTVTNKTEPDPFTQQWRSNVFGAAQNLFNQGPPSYYPGQTVVPFSPWTQAGLDQMTTQANGGAPNLQAANDASTIALAGGGANPGMQTAMNFANGNTQNIWGGQQLADTASGAAMNPYLDSMFNAAAPRVQDAVNSNFAKAGRYGANAAHTGALTREMGNLASSIYGPAYEAERQRQVGAAGQMAGMQLGGAELAGGLHTQGNSDALRAQALLPSLYQYGQMPADQLLQVGAANEGLQGQYIDDAMARYNYPYTSQVGALNNYASIVNGLPDFSGSTSTSTQRAATNKSMSGLGGAMAGAQAGSMFGPWGAGIGGALGGLWGLFG